jgi:hypothetical protein
MTAPINQARSLVVFHPCDRRAGESGEIEIFNPKAVRTYQVVVSGNDLVDLGFRERKDGTIGNGFLR